MVTGMFPTDHNFLLDEIPSLVYQGVIDNSLCSALALIISQAHCVLAFAWAFFDN